MSDITFELKEKVGQRFYMSHYKKRTVILEDVRNSKVKLKEIGMAHSFTLPIAKFLKFYTLKK